MDEIVDQIAATSGVDPATTRQAIGVIIGFISHEGPADAINRVMDAIPGARSLGDEHAAGGGLLGVFNDLTALGLGMAQIQTLTRAFIGACRAKIGDQAVDEVVNGIPGLAQFI